MATKSIAPMQVTKAARGLYEVQSSSRDLGYMVDPGKSCTCPHHAYRGATCKHLQAVDAHLAAQPTADAATTLQVKAQTLTDEQLLFCAARHAGTPAGTACLTEIANRLTEARLVAARPAIGTSVKVWGPTTDAEAWASLKGAVAA